MTVGLGGANGCVMAAGLIANRLKLSWRGPVGEDMKANFFGCVTQVGAPQLGGGREIF